MEHGHADLSLRPVAAAIGSSPRVLMFLFGNKDGLLKALLARARRRAGDGRAAALLDPLAIGDLERVTAAVELHAGIVGRTMPTDQQPVIRAATGEDLRDLQALARRVIDTCYRGFLGDEAVDWFIGSGASDEHVATHLDQGSIHCLVHDGRIIGLSILDGSTVDLMMVDPEHHRQGLGRVLLRHAEDTLLAQHPTIRLETFSGNTRAMSFYDACGWGLGERLVGEGPDKVEYLKSRATGPVVSSTLT
ncbi:GNAT family N-acetyltransferase [Nocardioides sp. NPDC047086]|uniref:GNAT family N-acetyltransferase n=1 Tax=Nocardioides sp. NPDC047086 TaxID=3154810 RepID=UPI0033C8A661